MPPPVISVENLSKRYLVGHRDEAGGAYRYTALRDALGREVRNIMRDKAADVARGRQVVQGDSLEEYWALRDISFEVNEGEVLGVIGENGASKSTLFKILSRITVPTDRRVTLRGWVAVSSRSAPASTELTGRERMFLSGAILSMSRAEIRKRFEQIVAFAEVEKFIDTPVKRHSSAFAVADHLEPQILIVHEVRAVGDAEFQKKCLGKMKRYLPPRRPLGAVRQAYHDTERDVRGRFTPPSTAGASSKRSTARTFLSNCLMRPNP